MSKDSKLAHLPDELSAEDKRVLKEIETVKDKTRKVGARMLKKCDETEEVAELTQFVLDSQTDQIQSINDNLDELEEKVKESKSLTKKFSSWFSIFGSNNSKTHYVVKNTNETKSAPERKMPEKKEPKEYNFLSDDPADEIASALYERVDKFAMYAQNYNKSLTKQSPMLDTIGNKIEKSDCDIKNISKTIKKF